ncbi:MAG: PhoPQ-activated protein PqaA family protein, partial [Verrucomicrobiales bacterium]|nr:PhoPQ-activated protein PqaA family protein [Verrucomicrobiales bacterium]
DALGDRRQAWVDAYDPGSHLGKCTVPTFWVNGTHDKHYVLDSYAKSYSQVQGPKTFRIEPRMGHSHGAGWAPQEIAMYVDSILKGGVPLPSVGEMMVAEDGTVFVPVSSQTKLVKAELHYTSDEGPRTEREWKVIAARLGDGKAVAKGLPEDANTWVMVVTDERDALVTSGVGFRGTP